MQQTPICRFCDNTLNTTFVDLGMSPLCQTQIKPEQLNEMEPFFPLHARVCEQCWLVQLDEFVEPSEIFASDYPYYSSFSASWVKHAADYCSHMMNEFDIGPSSFVVEVASNDGYLLQHFVKAGIKVLGVEPAVAASDAAREKGVASINRFFGVETAHWLLNEGYEKADLIVGNNVLAHVPNINDFVGGLGVLLKSDGVVTMEFPHLLHLIDQNQFDTIYHEHFSYLSLTFVSELFKAHGLEVFDVEQLPTHGGSLRIYACQQGNAPIESDRPAQLLERETDFGLLDVNTYKAFGARVEQIKRNILSFMIDAKNSGKKVVGYGAPGKGNTLLNYCGIRSDFLDFTVDLNPAKYGTYTPGTRIPIYHPDKIHEAKPDYVFILPWNLADEIKKQTDYIRDWGGTWVTPIPDVKIG